MPRPVLIALALLAIANSPVRALELTANAGFMSKYVFRGVPQSSSSAMGGLDLTRRGFSLGTWAADVGQGLEVDLYGGYAGSSGDLSYAVGFTRYFYTDDFDDDYRELNLNLGWKALSIEAAYGEYDNFSGPTQRYSYVAPQVEIEGFYAKVGLFGRDFNGE